MPDTPETHPDLQQALRRLRQAMADASSLSGINAELQRKAGRLLPLLSGEE
jgi:hypothetical protein